MNKLRGYRGVLLSVALAACSACDSAPYETAAVSGTVTLDGQPLTEGKIMFAPSASGGTAKAGKPASGKLDSEGKFVLSTYGNQDGAIVGNHWVTVIQTVLPNTPPGADPNTAESVKFNRYKLPTQQVVADSQENKIDIALTSAMLSE